MIYLNFGAREESAGKSVSHPVGGEAVCGAHLRRHNPVPITWACNPGHGEMSIRVDLVTTLVMVCQALEQLDLGTEKRVTSAVAQGIHTPLART